MDILLILLSGGIGGILGAIGGLISARADASKKISDAAISLVQPLERRITCLEEKLRESESRLAAEIRRREALEDKVNNMNAIITEWFVGIKILLVQVMESGEQPRWIPSQTEEEILSLLQDNEKTTH